jgi:hypothetical protein
VSEIPNDPKVDPLIENERQVLKAKLLILDALEPLSDEGRIRVINASVAYFGKVDDDDLYQVALRRLAARQEPKP